MTTSSSVVPSGFLKRRRVLVDNILQKIEFLGVVDGGPSVGERGFPSFSCRFTVPLMTR